MRICKFSLPGSAAAVALGLGISSGMAQVTPGQVGDTLKPPEPLRTAPSGQLPRAPSQAPRAAAASDARKIVVDHFVFEGNTVTSSEELQLLVQRSEEHTSELQSLMRISYAVFCLKKKKNKQK